LVYLPAPGAPIRIPLDSEGTLGFALFGRGRGTAKFRIDRPSGENLFQQTALVEGDLWEAHTLSLDGLSEAVLTVEAPPELRAGWGELVCDSARPPATGVRVASGEQPGLSYLNLADIRSKAQLRTGWYGIEDGGWRWMSKQAEAVLRVPAEGASIFEMQIFFPPDFIERAGGPITLSVLLDGHPFARETYRQPGGYRLEKAAPRDLPAGSVTHVALQLDRTAPPSESDRRELGMVVSRLGFVAP
jgi:hypothetical protein